MTPHPIAFAIFAECAFGALILLAFLFIQWKETRKTMTPIQVTLLGLIALIGIAILVSVAVLASAAFRYRQDAKDEQSLLARLQTAAEQTTGATPRKHPIDWSR